MGCDIHLYVERKVEGAWKSVHDFAPDKYGEGVADVSYEDRWYSDRNYDLFAILADVRNGHGFAGVATGEGFTPIADPKGIPADCDPQIKARSDEWGGDGHSHSHFTLAELLAYDWQQSTRKFGVVNGPEMDRWSGWRRSRGLGPESYSADVMGSGISKGTESELTAALKRTSDAHPGDRKARNEAIERTLGRTYARITWIEAYHRAADGFWSDLMPRLTRTAFREHLSFDDIRIVFWFDN